MNPLELLGQLSRLGPILFGLGFLAPLTAQSLDALGVEGAFGASNLAIGLVVGTTAGVVARVRGAWL